jgi:23S rRNA (adenine2503-C2)-methyltransferase
MTRSDIEHALNEIGAPRFHASQIFSWIYRHGVTDFAAMTNLPASLRERLAREVIIETPAIERRETSSDGTTKYLLRLTDGKRIEAVYIPDTPAQTFCISTQVGCAMACAFCLTGKMGLARHLTADEIAGQVRVLAHDTGLANKSFNVVLMGMGEPLHNYDATMQALGILADKEGLAMNPKRVTLSTVGIVPALERLASEPLMPNLAISLHATTDELRSRIVPVNRKYDLAELLDVCRRFPVAKRRRITFEYVLLAGVNDTPADARRLVRMLDGIKAKVNLLPFNEAPGLPFTRPTDERVNEFARSLSERGLTVSVRRSRGRDIRAACGQLLVEGTARSTGQRLANRLSESPQT